MSWAEEAVLEDAIKKAAVNITIDGDVDVTDAMKLEASVEFPVFVNNIIESGVYDIKARLFYTTIPYIFSSGVSVVYNNEIHILGSNKDGNKRKHYKWVGTDWVEVSTLPIDFNYASAVVYNNEIHIFGTLTNTAHYKWNGVEWIEASTFPENISGKAVVYNDEIHVLGAYETGTNAYTDHYKWDGSEWVSMPTLPTRMSIVDNAVVYDNEIHIFSTPNTVRTNTLHYKWDGIEWTQSADIPYYAYYATIVVYNNEIHCIGGGDSTHPGYEVCHYKFDGVNWHRVTMPFNICLASSVVYKNKIHILGGEINYDNCSTHYTYDGVKHEAIIRTDFNKVIHLTGYYSESIPFDNLYSNAKFSLIDSNSKSDNWYSLITRDNNILLISSLIAFMYGSGSFNKRLVISYNSNTNKYKHLKTYSFTNDHSNDWLSKSLEPLADQVAIDDTMLFCTAENLYESVSWPLSALGTTGEQSSYGNISPIRYSYRSGNNFKAVYFLEKNTYYIIPGYDGNSYNRMYSVENFGMSSTRTPDFSVTLIAELPDGFNSNAFVSMSIYKNSIIMIQSGYRRVYSYSFATGSWTMLFQVSRVPTKYNYTPIIRNDYMYYYSSTNNTICKVNMITGEQTWVIRMMNQQMGNYTTLIDTGDGVLHNFHDNTHTHIFDMEAPIYEIINKLNTNTNLTITKK